MGVCYPGDSDFRSHLYCYLLLLLLFLVIIPFGGWIFQDSVTYILCVLEASNPFDLNFLANKHLQNCNSPQRIYCTQCIAYVESACLILLNRTFKKVHTVTIFLEKVPLHQKKVLWYKYLIEHCFILLYILYAIWIFITLYHQQFFFL
jgi:hypothetical protein